MRRVQTASKWPWPRQGVGILSRRLVVLAVGSSALVGAWLVGVHGIAAALARASPERALQIDPGQSSALLHRLSTARDAITELAIARDVLRRRPLDGRAYRAIAENAPKASMHRLYRIAERRDPRDRETLAWLADEAIEAGDNALAFHFLGRLARIDLILRPQVYSLLMQLATSPPATAALAMQLSQEPAWAPDFLATWYAHVDPRRRRGPEQVLERIPDRADIMTPALGAARVDAALRAGEWDAAYLAWSESAGASAAPGAVINGDFGRAPQGEFDWLLADRPGAVVVREAPALDAHAGQLRVQSRGDPGLGPLASQRLLLRPGPYRLVYRYRMSAVDGQSGFLWRLSCKGGPEGTPAFARSAPMRSGPDWRTDVLPFVVPAGCAHQWLVLERAGEEPLQRLSQGTLLIDLIHIGSPRRSGAAPAEDRKVGAQTGHRVRPVAFLVAVGSAGVTVVRGGHTFPGAVRMTLQPGDQFMRGAGDAWVRWAHGCERRAAALTSVQGSPCADRADPAGVSVSDLPSRPTMQLLRSLYREQPSARDLDDPVGP